MLPVRFCINFVYRSASNSLFSTCVSWYCFIIITVSIHCSFALFHSLPHPFGQISPDHFRTLLVVFFLFCFSLFVFFFVWFNQFLNCILNTCTFPVLPFHGSLTPENFFITDCIQLPNLADSLNVNGFSLLSRFCYVSSTNNRQREALCFRVCRPSVRPSGVRPSVRTYFAWRDVSVLGGGILMKLGIINIRQVSGHCWKGFQMSESKVKVIARPGALLWRRHTFRQCDVEVKVKGKR